MNLHFQSLINNFALIGWTKIIHRLAKNKICFQPFWIPSWKTFKLWLHVMSLTLLWTRGMCRTLEITGSIHSFSTLCILYMYAVLCKLHLPWVCFHHWKVYSHQRFRKYSTGDYLPSSCSLFCRKCETGHLTKQWTFTLIGETRFEWTKITYKTKKSLLVFRHCYTRDGLWSSFPLCWAVPVYTHLTECSLQHYATWLQYIYAEHQNITHIKVIDFKF